MSLTEYQRKRNFRATPEPAAGGERGNRIFVVQLHHASHRHFDFRLEVDGVLKSWAVPKGPSLDPTVKRLAMEVEDHPLSYARFEGDIPKGNYGAGHVDVFDQGIWQPEGDARASLAAGELKFTLHGDVLRGSWVLVRTRKQGAKNQWLLIKHRDAFADARDANAFVDPRTDRPISAALRRKIWTSPSEPKPKPIATNKAIAAADAAVARWLAAAPSEKIKDAPFAPELCRSLDAPPTGTEWLHEVKWDGYRLVATVVRKQVRLWSRNAIEWTAKVPELASAIRSLDLTSAQLDGEMIVLRDGRDDFNALQARLSGSGPDELLYMLFDITHLNGKSLRDLPLLQRKAILHALLVAHPRASLRFSEHHIGDGAAAFAQAISAGLEGIVSKQADSPYRSTRSGAWAKIKQRPSDEFVVVGYTEPKGQRDGIGALLLAQPRNGELVYVGRVGTGLDNEQLNALRKRLVSWVVSKPSADLTLMARRDRPLAIWVKPKLVVEAFYQGIGGHGLLRQPAFKALRADKSVAQILASAGAGPMKQGGDTVQAGAGAVTRGIRARLPTPKQKPLAATTGSTRKSVESLSGNADKVAITHPERMVFPEANITKGEVAAYYRLIAPWLLREIADRPLSVVRCPDGSADTCFFQKHAGKGWGDRVLGVTVREKQGQDKYLCIEDETGLMQLVQMNVLEFHPWGATAADSEHADRVVFDLDPGKSVPFARVAAAARDVRKQLKSIGLESYLRTSGGKGLHVVVPLNPPAPWDEVKAFAQGVAQAMAQLRPDAYVSVAGEKNRRGRIFVDWLRNGRGATSVACYSLRARPTAGVAMPLAWTELSKVRSGDAFTLVNAGEKVRRRRTDPWAAIATTRQRLPKFR
ncbi:MAG: DNA ligase D [Tahibacter sp.]